ncbi:MAG: PIN domain-containing protein [Candidatus Azobacteroides sp.]|nr:PIN domain-containing protein [Candidatus Azobacteroides sp.]
MKTLFPGYSRKSDIDLNKMWKESVLIFDANVLLNLYRYSDYTRDTILDLIEKFSDRIWLPYQAALEYNRNRYEVIVEQEKAYNEFINKIEQIQKDLKSKNKPPFLSNLVHENLNQVFGKVISEVKDSINKYADYLKDDPIYDRLCTLFYRKISQPYEEELLQEIYAEGKTRFEKKIPPGFEDEKNKEDDNKYGDLVLWKQIIDKGKETGKSIIFITDERKIDWWWKIRDGRNMGPRQELIAEINQEANIDFHMYSSERFLSYGQNYLEENVNQKALDEIKALKRAEAEEFHKREVTIERNREIMIEKLQKKYIYIQHQISKLEKKIYEINIKQKELKISYPNDMEFQEYGHSLTKHAADLQFEKENLQHMLMDLEKERIELEEWFDKEKVKDGYRYRTYYMEK